MLCYKSKISHTLVRDGVALPTNSMMDVMRAMPVRSVRCMVGGRWSVVVTAAKGDMVCGCDANAGLGDRPGRPRGAYLLDREVIPP